MIVISGHEHDAVLPVGLPRAVVLPDVHELPERDHLRRRAEHESAVPVRDGRVPPLPGAQLLRPARRDAPHADCATVAEEVLVGVARDAELSRVSARYEHSGWRFNRVTCMKRVWAQTRAQTGARNFAFESAPCSPH